MACGWSAIDDHGGITCHDDGGAMALFRACDLIADAGDAHAMRVGACGRANDDATVICAISDDDERPHIFPSFVWPKLYQWKQYWYCPQTDWQQ